MTHEQKNVLAGFAVLALLVISLVTIVGGMAVAVYGREVEGVVAVATGAIGGIVAIALREKGT